VHRTSCGNSAMACRPVLARVRSCSGSERTFQMFVSRRPGANGAWLASSCRAHTKRQGPGVSETPRAWGEWSSGLERGKAGHAPLGLFPSPGVGASWLEQCLCWVALDLLCSVLQGSSTCTYMSSTTMLRPGGSPERRLPPREARDGSCCKIISAGNPVFCFTKVLVGSKPAPRPFSCQA